MYNEHVLSWLSQKTNDFRELGDIVSYWRFYDWYWTEIRNSHNADN